MENGGTTHHVLLSVLTRYLQSWGLREFRDEAAYYEWQRASLPLSELQSLQSLVDQRQGGANEQADIRFYDLLAKPPLLPVLYSQRFDYFRQIGLLLSPRLSSTEHVLDFGCGVGILTCFFAQQHPDVQFVGIDRSSQSIEIARKEKKRRHLPNVEFRVSQNLDFSPGDVYDCILSTQAMLQSEHTPGLPSRNWRTFEREDEPSRQEELEKLTGLNIRLDSLINTLSPGGRMICFEKTWNLGRRIFFQRALDTRGLYPVCEPISCSYHELGETRTDGPVYEVSRIIAGEPHAWNEIPYFENGETLFRCRGDLAERMGRELVTSRSLETVKGQHSTKGTWTFRFGIWEQVLVWGLCETSSGLRGLLLASEKERNVIAQLVAKVRILSESEFERFLQYYWDDDDASLNKPTPGYENHHPSAQDIYQQLPQKVIQQESTFADGQGKEMHIEVGMTKTFRYLYWANTLDQRQLVLMDEKGEGMLHEYYQESLEAARESS